MLVSLVVLGLYAWTFFADVDSLSATILVSTEAAGFAGLALLVSFILYLWIPRKHITAASYASLALLVALSATLILGTGMTNSPFIALWMVVSVFAGIFGIYGIAPLLGLLAAYVAFAVTTQNLDNNTLITITLGGILPLIVSYLIWHTGRSSQGSGDRAYRELATELSQVADKAEIVINGITDGVVAINGQGAVELINPAAQRIIGWSKQDAMGLNYKSILKLIDAKGNELTDTTDPINSVLATNKPTQTDDFTLVTHSGKNILGSLMISPVGQIGSGVIIVFRDITSEKMEERQQAEFISTASHEMRTPVASIEGYLGLALNPSTAQIDDKARDYITKAHESAQHLGRLFQDLLDVSKAEDGRLSSNPKVTDTVEFVHDIVQGLRPQASEKGLFMTFKPQPDDGEVVRHEERGERTLSPIYYVNVDNDHLREVVANLVENAIKYTPRGDVTIDITGDSDTVTISVADSGIGIPREDQGHLFQKFYRVDNTDTREIGGTGLGLYLCRRLTETMNGRIWVESEYKKGSTFFVSLPRLAADEATRIIEQSAGEPIPEVGPAFVAPTAAPLTAAAPVQPVAPQPIQPTQPIAAPSIPVTQTPLPSPATARINIPISAIEQNKTAYTEPSSPQIPPREQN